MFSARTIRQAVEAVSHKPSSFPYGVTLDEAALNTIRQEPALAEARRKITEYAEKARSSAIPAGTFADFLAYEKTGDRKAFETPMYERRCRMQALMVTALLEADGEGDLRCLEELAWAICDEYTWASPAHYPVGVEAATAHRFPPDRVVDLFAAMTAQLLAELDLLFGERLHPWIRYRIREEVERRVFRPVYDTPQRFGWESAAHNWNAVCMGSAGVAALILIEDKERLIAMMDRTVGAMECYLEGFGADGGCPEGVGYWNFGFSHFTEFAEALRTYTNGEINLFTFDKIRNIAEFPYKAALSDGVFVPFSDAPPQIKANTATLGKLSSLLPIRVPYLADVEGELRRSLPGLRSMLWADPGTIGKPVQDGSFYFPNQQWLIDRRKLGEAAFAFAAKGGHNDEPHNHNDVGQFILHIDGESLLTDLGAGKYTRASFGPNRYDLMHNGSHGHCVPKIGGGVQQSGRDYAAKDVHYETATDGCHFRMNLTQAYDIAQLENLERCFHWIYGSDGAFLQLEDSFRFQEESLRIEEVFISEIEPNLEPGRVQWMGRSGYAILHYDADRLTAEAEAIPTENHFGEPMTVYRLVLTAEPGALEATFRFSFALNKY